MSYSIKIAVREVGELAMASVWSISSVVYASYSLIERRWKLLFVSTEECDEIVSETVSLLSFGACMFIFVGVIFKEISPFSMRRRDHTPASIYIVQHCTGPLTCACFFARMTRKRSILYDTSLAWNVAAYSDRARLGGHYVQEDYLAGYAYATVSWPQSFQRGRERGTEIRGY